MTDLSRPPAEPPAARTFTQLVRTIEQSENPPVAPQPDADEYDPDHVKGYCPDCGHHWAHHQAGGCRYLCDCRRPRP